MKTIPAASEPSQKPLIVLSIDGHDYMLPSATDLSAVLNALAGLRRISTSYFYHVEPREHVVADNGPAEFSVSSWARRLVSEEEMKDLRKRDEEAREKINREPLAPGKTREVLA